MKVIILSSVIIAAVLTACANNDTGSVEKTQSTNDTSAKANTEMTNTATAQTASVDKVVTSYIQLKNALANDNGNDAASAGKQMSEAMTKLDATSFSADQKKMYDEVKDDIKEHAEHISTNGSKIEHQREHFEMLSKDMYDLVKVSEPSQTLYLDHCPMYNDNKGADWLSEVKEIKNPYLGKKMPDCGEVKEEIK
jgi:hypothetical protein